MTLRDSMVPGIAKYTLGPSAYIFCTIHGIFNNFSGGMGYIKKKKIEIKLLQKITTVSDMDNTGTAD